MANKFFGRTGYTGGTTEDADGIDGALLSDGDAVFVQTATAMSGFIVDADSGAAEDSPKIIKPDTNAGNKRLILQDLVTDNITAYGNIAVTGTVDGRDVAADGTRLDTLTDADPTIKREPDQAVHMVAAGSGSNGISIADDTDINFATGNLTLHWKGNLTDWINGAYQYILLKIDSFALRVNATGYLSLYAYSVPAEYLSTSPMTAVDGANVDITVVITNGTSVIFYVDGAKLGSTVVVPSITFTSANSLYILGTDLTRTGGTCSAVALYNKALTATEVADLYRNGVNYSDKWGNQTDPVSGAVLSLEPEGILSDKWYDSSSNALDAAYPAAGSSATRRLASYVSNTAYGVSWNNVTTIAPSKDAVYDKIQTLQPIFTATAPIVKTGTVINLVNDVSAEITQFDTGTLANSETVVPVSKVVYGNIVALQSDIDDIITKFSSATAPSPTQAGMWWVDTGNHILKLRNEADDAWLNIWDLANNKPYLPNILLADIPASFSDAAAGTASLRSLSTTGTTACAGNDSRLLSRSQLFTSSGTWTRPSGVTTVCVILQGGGGGGGGSGSISATNGGGGGGSGAFAEYNCTVSGDVTVTVGAGGAGGATGTTGATGSTGGTTSFGTLAVAAGGVGGTGGSNATSSPGSGGAGGAASGTGTASNAFSIKGNDGIAGTVTGGYGGGKHPLYGVFTRGSGGNGGDAVGAGSAGADGSVLVLW